MKRAFFCILPLFLVSSLFAQKYKQFSEDPAEFYSELTSFLKATKNQKLTNQLEIFDELWTGGSFGSSEEDKFIDVCNLLLKKKYIANPDFTALLTATNSFYKNEISSNTFYEFLTVLDTMVQLKFTKAQTRTYMGFFPDLNKNGQLFVTKSKNWSVADISYVIEMKKVPQVVFENTDLALAGSKDTLLIINTSGRCFPLTEEWRGNEGEVNWARVGLYASDVYAELKKYKIDFKKQGYTADSVLFTNTDAYPDPIEGTFEDQLDARGEKSAYPQFKSFKRKFKLDDLDDYLVYNGGFGMEGRRIVGTGSGYYPATLKILKDGKKFITLTSYNFYIEPERIVAGNATVTLYLNGDSIYHPSLSIRINREERYLKFSTSPNNLVQAPFSNTFHQLEMYADQMECHLDSSFVDIRSVRDPDGRASFESVNYFSRKRFEKMRGNMSYNPIFKMNELFILYQKRIYTEDELVGFFGVDKIEQIQTQLLLLSTQGFITYDPRIKEMILNDKLFTYINAYLKKVDFDVIQLNSISKDQPNSRLFLENNHLEVHGINTVKLSDSQSVQIYPYQKTITFKKNRDMLFDGYLKAGRFEYFGKGFEFVYSDFQINMSQIDSMMFNFPDEKAGGIVRRVNTVIQNITGKLNIDKPDNKSGRLDAPNYPIFDCFKGAFVYYDYKSVFNGVYERDRFFFKLKPFIVDSLDNFSMAGMNLDGTFKSAKILPDFDYKLNLQPDFSLGFATETPPDGYPLYNGTGHCNMKIFLSNSGLRGSGKFTYNGAEIESEDMLFFPDSMQALQTVFAMDDKERKKFPDVNSQNCELTWTPYADTMIIAAIDSTAFINMYEEESFLKGRLVFTKKEMYGNGEFNYRQGLARSENYNFKHRKLSADSTEFELYDDSARVALTNASIKMNIDFDKRILKAETNYDEVFTELPINQYSTNIPEFKWDVDEKKVFLEKGEGTDDIDFFFVSTNPVFDSLTFAPSSAELDLTTFEIEAFDIKYFLVADSRVVPASAVQIGENGVIPALTNAEIIASHENEFHIIKSADVNIFSSKKFTGTGLYNYIDPNEKVWELEISEIRSTEEGLTRGIGVIPDSMGFHFGPNMGYNGDLIFTSDKKEIEFNGEVDIEHDHIQLLGTQKFKFEGRVAFDSLYFNITEAKNSLGQELHSGIFLNTRTRNIYPVFLGTKQTPNDLELFRASGDLYLDLDSNMFVITDFERYYNEDMRPSQWVFAMDSNVIYMDGPLNMDYAIENFDFKLSSRLSHNLKTETTTMEMAGGINMPFHENALKVMSDSLINFGFFNSDVDNTKEFVASGVARQFESEKDAQKSIDNLYRSGNVPTYKEYRPLVNFAPTQLVWDTTSKAFTNAGQIGIANIGGFQVNKNLNGRISFFKTLQRDSISLYWEGNAGNWYLFTFVEEELYVGSSDAEFVDRALYKKPKDIIGRLSFNKATEEMIANTRSKAVRKEEE